MYNYFNYDSLSELSVILDDAHHCTYEMKDAYGRFEMLEYSIDLAKSASTLDEIRSVLNPDYYDVYNMEDSEVSKAIEEIKSSIFQVENQLVNVERHFEFDGDTYLALGSIDCLDELKNAIIDISNRVDDFSSAVAQVEELLDC